MRRRLAALACSALACGAMGVALLTAGPAATGCTTHQCDQSSYDWFSGFMQDPDTYVSNDRDQTWLDFNGNTTVNIWFPPQVAGRIAKTPVVNVGTDSTPNSAASRDAGFNYIQGVGQLGILNTLETFPTPIMEDGHLVGGGFAVTNSTCQMYFLHVEVTFERASTDDAAEGPLDGGSSGDATSD